MDKENKLILYRDDEGRVSVNVRFADAMVDKGLKDAGYDHINIDDGFFGGRDTETGELKNHSQQIKKNR